MSGYISDKSDVMQRPRIFCTLAVSNALASTIGSLLAGLPVIFEESMGLDVVGAHALLFWVGAISTFLGLLFLLPINDVKTRKAEIT